MYVLIANVSEFMESQVTEYLAASNNKQALDKLAKECLLVNPDGNFDVIALKKPSQLQYVSFGLSDWNYASYEDSLLGEDLDLVNELALRLERENPEANVSVCTLEPYHSMTRALRLEILSKYHSDPKRLLEGKRWRERSMNNGQYYKNPKKYEFYQGVYLG
ncbi:hypothetical protein [Vibrio owensii]|uniref:hypothetical protein n=1 Tax=Vibrio owensii TaxID=696485 RepID=UPI003CC5EC1A